MRKVYTSNLTYEQFELIKPLLPPAKKGGRPRCVCLFSVLNAIFYLVVQGCKWRDLPADFPPWQTVYTYFRNWRLDGTWDMIHQHLRILNRVMSGREESPREVIVDSQSVPTSTMVNKAVGYNTHKATKGRKRHTVVDTLGLVMCVLVTAANVPEREGGKKVLARLQQLGEQVCRLFLVWVDGGYSGEPFLRFVMDTFGWIVQMVLRPQESKDFILLKNVGWLSAPLAGGIGIDTVLKTTSIGLKTPRPSFTSPLFVSWFGV